MGGKEKKRVSDTIELVALAAADCNGSTSKLEDVLMNTSAPFYSAEGPFTSVLLIS